MLTYVLDASAKIFNEHEYLGQSYAVCRTITSHRSTDHLLRAQRPKAKSWTPIWMNNFAKEIGTQNAGSFQAFAR
jgi:hypothetical protein